MKPLYHSGKFKGRSPVTHGRDSHGVHPVQLSLHASSTSVIDRNVRHVTPDRLTRDQATTFRPSDLPIGQGNMRSSAHSDGGSSRSNASGPLTTIGFGPSTLLHTMSETRMLGNSSRKNVVSPNKVYATELTQLSSGDNYARRNSGSQEGSSFFSQQQFQDLTPRGNGKASQSQTQKNTPFLPGDRVIFAESPSAPGIPIVYRSVEERSANPDRLNLDRRCLSVCPILEGEEHLRLLNFQHNSISRIQHLSNLRRLIFLDLYDNQIKDMSGLSALKSLRVLMLGKNRISQISGLDNLVKLDVLDLHGNNISVMENLNHLTELRVLNLAGNHIEHVNNLSGMETLAELNLRRNCIVRVSEIDLLMSLQRLFLSFNNISSWTHIECLSDCSTLSEISLDGNPIASASWYKQVVLKNMGQLRQLDMKRISDDERRASAIIIKKEEERKREVHKQAIAKEKKKLAINNAARQWESALQYVNQNYYTGTSSENSQSTGRSEIENYPHKEEENEFVDKSAWLSTVLSSKHNQDSFTSLDISDAYLAEIEGGHLQLFGHGALDSLDKNWGSQASSAVTTITIQFINFENFSFYIPKIRSKFSNIKNLIMKEVNLHSLQQFNALSQFQKLNSLSVEESPGNPVTQFSLWKSYLLFRLAHLQINTLNDKQVVPADISSAEKLFGSLGLLCTTHISQFRLAQLLGESQQKQSSKESKKKSSENETIRESIVRAGLQYFPKKHEQNLENQARKAAAKDLVHCLNQEAIQISAKKEALHDEWPIIVLEMVKNMVFEMNDLAAYKKEQFKKFESLS